MHLRSKTSLAEAVREIVFGLEDSLVSTMGALTGIAVGTNDRSLIILSGLVILFVEASSMAAGSFLSTETAELVERQSAKNVRQRSVKAALVMAVSYLFGGVIPFAPYLLLPPATAIFVSVFLTILALVGVGIWASRYTKRAPWKSAGEMVLVSLFAAAIGYFVGRLVSFYFGLDIMA